jgi:hypothetical protein
VTDRALPGEAIVAALERAEMVAGERRLTATAEADGIDDSAAVRVRAIEAELAARVQAALDALRDEHLRQADE